MPNQHKLILSNDELLNSNLRDELILNLKKLGVSVIVISHRMDDIFTVCDRVMALFQGTNFAESELKNTSRDEVIGWIMGKKD